MWLSKQKVFSIQRQSLFFFLISTFISFFPLLISILKKFYKALYTVYPFLQKIGRQDYHLFGAMHITLRGLRFFDVGIIYHILGKVKFQISFTNYENCLAHNTALFTSGNSGLPHLNPSRKSSDIPLPTQSPIWANPMGPFTLSFGKKCYNVTTPGDNLQISSTKHAFIECMFLPCRLRSLHQGYFPDLIDQHDQHSVSTGIHVNETRSQQSVRAAFTQWSTWRCALRTLFDM